MLAPLELATIESGKPVKSLNLVGRTFVREGLTIGNGGWLTIADVESDMVIVVVSTAGEIAGIISNV